MPQLSYRLRRPDDERIIPKEFLADKALVSLFTDGALSPHHIGFALRTWSTKTGVGLETFIKGVSIDLISNDGLSAHFAPAGEYVARSEHLQSVFSSSRTTGINKSFVRYYANDAFDLVPTVWKYAARIKKEEYPDFSTSLKSFGFSSRSYKKVDDWLWISDTEVVAPIRLISDAPVVNLHELHSDYSARQIKYT